MGALSDALVNAGMKVAQAVIIERGITNSGAKPGTEEFKAALMASGVDQHTATALSAALLSSVSGDWLRTPPTMRPLPAGAIAEWTFGEGVGATVYDGVGANHINLAAPASQVYAWTGRGVDTSGGGMVQTPSLTGVRTVVMLCRTGRGETGSFLISGGSSSGSGVLQGTLTGGWPCHAVANARSVAPVRAATSGATRSGAWALNRGGWVLLFQEFSTPYTTILGLGGRHSMTTARAATFEIAYAAAFSGPLSAADRDAIHQRVRSIVARRGIVLHPDDAASHRDGLLLLGDSNAAGSNANGPLVASLTTWQAAQTYAATRMIVGNQATRPTIPPVSPVPGATVVDSTTLHGPELGIAAAQGIDAYSEPEALLSLVKSATGSTFVVPPGTGSAVASTSYLPVATAVSDVRSYPYHTAQADWLDMAQWEALQGVGLRRIGACIMLGTNDSTVANVGETYRASMLSLIAALREDMGDPLMPIVLVQIRDDIPAGIPASRTAIRQVQADLVAADPRLRLVPVDRYPIGVDGLHYRAAAYPLGMAIYAAWRDAIAGR